MRTLSDDELSAKINAFIGKKMLQYPELNREQDSKSDRLWHLHGNVKRNAQLTWLLLAGQRLYGK